jgi:hypothetical protein
MMRKDTDLIFVACFVLVQVMWLKAILGAWEQD